MPISRFRAAGQMFITTVPDRAIGDWLLPACRRTRGGDAHEAGAGSRYGLRKTLPEPVFGQINQASGA